MNTLLAVYLMGCMFFLGWQIAAAKILLVCQVHGHVHWTAKVVGGLLLDCLIWPLVGWFYFLPQQTKVDLYLKVLRWVGKDDQAFVPDMISGEAWRRTESGLWERYQDEFGNPIDPPELFTETQFRARVNNGE